MADAVAEIYDQNGRLQVSAGMLGMVCRRTGTGTSRSRITGNTAPSSLEVDVAGMSRPVVAIRMDGYAAALAGRSYPSGSSSATNVAFACSAPVGTAFTYWVFDWTQALPANNGLFQLFTQDGRCTFSSAFWPMKMVGVIAMPDGGQFDGTAGMIYAGACSAMGGHSHAQGVYCADGNSGPTLPGDGELENCKNIRGNIDGKLYGSRSLNNGQSVQGANVSYDDVTGGFGDYASYQNYGDGWEVPNGILIVDVTGIPIGQTFF